MGLQIGLGVIERAVENVDAEVPAARASGYGFNRKEFIGTRSFSDPPTSCKKPTLQGLLTELPNHQRILQVIVTPTPSHHLGKVHILGFNELNPERKELKHKSGNYKVRGPTKEPSDFLQIPDFLDALASKKWEFTNPTPLAAYSLLRIGYKFVTQLRRRLFTVAMATPSAALHCAFGKLRAREGPKGLKAYKQTSSNYDSIKPIGVRRKTVSFLTYSMNTAILMVGLKLRLMHHVVQYWLCQESAKTARSPTEMQSKMFETHPNIPTAPKHSPHPF